MRPDLYSCLLTGIGGPPCLDLGFLSSLSMRAQTIFTDLEAKEVYKQEERLPIWEVGFPRLSFTNLHALKLSWTEL
jgi:hypothetical protein